MKRWLIFLLVLPLLACSVPSTSPQSNVSGVDEEPAEALLTVADLPDLGDAPELTNEVWLNTDTPLRLAYLRGKVILLEMWTFG